MQTDLPFLEIPQVVDQYSWFLLTFHILDIETKITMSISIQIVHHVKGETYDEWVLSKLAIIFPA